MNSLYDFEGRIFNFIKRFFFGNDFLENNILVEYVIFFIVVVVYK